MNLKIKLFSKELELRRIKYHKHQLLSQQKYEEAIPFKEQEDKMRKEIKILVCELKTRFDNLEIKEENFMEMEKLSILLSRYEYSNDLLYQKISTYYQNKLKDKEKADSTRDFKRCNKIREELSVLNKYFSKILKKNI